MNDSKLREEILDRINDAQAGIDDDEIKSSLAKLATKEIMALFTQALTARLDAVAGAMPEKTRHLESGDYENGYVDGHNTTLAACHAAIDTVRRGL